jgi:hypothetical protein
MNFISHSGPSIVMREIPIMLLLATAIFSLPFLAFSLFHIVRGSDADGKWFCLFFGLVIGWLMLEFVATRERIQLNRNTRTFLRTVNGVFRKREQLIDLTHVDRINLQIKNDVRGRRRQYLYLCGDRDYLINTPAKVYKDHRKTGRAISEITQLPFEITDPFRRK